MKNVFEIAYKVIGSIVYLAYALCLSVIWMIIYPVILLVCMMLPFDKRAPLVSNGFILYQLALHGFSTKRLLETIHRNICNVELVELILDSQTIIDINEES